MQIFPVRRTDRANAVLHLLASRVPPRTWAAVWRTLWNGWATDRRMQGRGAVHTCIYGCSVDAPDSIEHYACCPRLASICGPVLALPRAVGAGPALADFLAVDVASSQMNPDTVVRKAIRMAGAYRVHSLVRHRVVRPGAAAIEALRQSLREVVRGHRAACRAYDTVYLQGWA